MRAAACRFVPGFAGRTAKAQVNPGKAVPEIPEPDSEAELAPTLCAAVLLHVPLHVQANRVREASSGARGIQLRTRVP